jgi:Basic region leucine zipper
MLFFYCLISSVNWAAMGRTRKETQQSSDADSDDITSYRTRRDRNNMAVRKSREKSRARKSETSKKLTQLREENAQLEVQIGSLGKEVKLLKDLLLVRAGKKQVAKTDDDTNKACTSDTMVSSSDSHCSNAVANIENDIATNSATVQRDHGYFSTRHCSH